MCVCVGGGGGGGGGDWVKSTPWVYDDNVNENVCNMIENIVLGILRQRTTHVWLYVYRYVHVRFHFWRGDLYVVQMLVYWHECTSFLPYSCQWTGSSLIEAMAWCLLSKQSRRMWFETPSRSLWRNCNGMCQSRETTTTKLIPAIGCAYLLILSRPSITVKKRYLCHFIHNITS